MKREVRMGQYTLNELVNEQMEFGICTECGIEVVVLRKGGQTEVLDYPDKSGKGSDVFSGHTCDTVWDPDLGLWVNEWIAAKMGWSKETTF